MDVFALSSMDVFFVRKTLIEMPDVFFLQTDSDLIPDVFS